MAKIFSVPTEIKKPEFSFSSFKESMEKEEKYVTEIKRFCKEQGSGSLAGEIVSIPHADGNAMYMVFSEKPLQLIHLDIGDAWDSPFADLLTLKKVKEMVEGRKKLSKLFGKHN